MYSCKDSAQRCFFIRSRKALKRTINPRQNFRSHSEIEMILSKDRNQDGRSSSANDRMRAGVCGIWRCVPDLGKPIGIRQRGWIAVVGSLPDCSHRSPEVIGVLGVVKGNHSVGEAEV